MNEACQTQTLYGSRRDDGLGRTVTSNFCNLIEQGHVKEAAVSATSFTRSRLREEGFTRKIYTPLPIADDQLDKQLDSDKPRKILELEPDSQATYVAFRGMAPARYFTGKFYEAVFGKIQSERQTKSIFELKTYDNDIRKILSDNLVKDIHGEEDGAYIATCNDIVAANPVQQNLVIGGGVTRKNVAEAMKALPKMKLPNGCILMNDVTSKDILKWEDTDIGDAALTEQYYNGLTTGKIMGIRTLFTIKREIIPDNVMYFFTTEDFLGKFFIMLEPTVYIKHEADLLQFWLYECIAIAIGNTKGVVKVTFT